MRVALSERTFAQARKMIHQGHVMRARQPILILTMAMLGSRLFRRKLAAFRYHFYAHAPTRAVAGIGSDFLRPIVRQELYLFHSLARQMHQPVMQKVPAQNRKQRQRRFFRKHGLCRPPSGANQNRFH